MKKETKQQKRYRRHKRVRAKIYGTAACPRLCVFRSAKHIYAQLMDDEKGETLVVASDLEIKDKKGKRLRPTQGRGVSLRESASRPDRPLTHPPTLNMKRSGKVAIAYEVGKLIAEKALKKTTTRPPRPPARFARGPLIEKVVFDRGGYKYHGRVKALAEGARSAGLKF